MGGRGFFKAYDMRGTFGEDFDAATVYRAGLALPGVAGGPRWLVGRDCRKSGETLRDALVAGLSAAGAEVSDIGLCTTPMVYHFTAAEGFDASAMITASHNPPCDNGVKVSRRGAVPVGYADGLCKVEEAVARMDGEPFAPRAGAGRAGADAARVRGYVAFLRTLADPGKYSGLRYAADCSCGMASLLAEGLFPGALLLNAGLDGAFPAHSPNPLLPEAREQAARAVRANGLDCAVIFDGDADRAMFVDGEGRFASPDMLIPAVAEQAAAATGAARAAGAKVLHDVRTSRGAIEALKEAGFEPFMVPVGHVFAKRAMRETGALCGGELAGHYYFRDFHCCDSGALAAMRVLAAVADAKSRGKTFARMLEPVAGRYFGTGELNYRVEDKKAATERALAAAARYFPPELSRSEMDGVRVEYGRGWFNIRQSNTEPYLRLVAECDTPERLAEWREILENAITEKNK